MDDILGGDVRPQYDPNTDANFAMIYAETGDPIIAATRAGIQNQSESIIVTAQRYLMRPEIKAAIAVIQQLERETPAIVITRDSIIESCQAVFESAHRDRQYGSAIAALKLQSALKGYLDQKVTVSHDYNIKFMSTAELQRLVSGAPDIDGEYRNVTPEDAA